MSQVKQVLVVRTKFPDANGELKSVRTGKMIAQAAHASMGALLSQMMKGDCDHLTGGAYAFYEGEGTRSLLWTPDEATHQWLNGPFTKICVQVDTAEELIALRDQAETAGLMHCLIQDSGRTEFKGVPTYTVLAIGPGPAEEIDKITGKLKLF